MTIRQTRIYTPAKPPYDTNLWAETVMARILKPLVDRNPQLRWVWFTRYVSGKPEFADSDGANVPPDFFDNNLCRSIRFRFEINDDDLDAFEQQAADLIRQEGCWIADWRDYGIGELSSNRFVGEDRSQARRDERLGLVKRHVESVSRLMLHALVPADNEGRFRVENNDDQENPHNSAFFSLHHLFCNTTEVLLTALVSNDGFTIDCGTRQYPQSVVVQNQGVPVKEFPIRF
jgi:hypothetical protein